MNLSFALNYYLGRHNPLGYHVFNLILHFCAALLVWAIVRRTLRLEYFEDRFSRTAEVLALGIATVWAMHPLTTDAVLYVTQRTELMMALAYLGRCTRAFVILPPSLGRAVRCGWPSRPAPAWPAALRRK